MVILQQQKPPAVVAKGMAVEAGGRAQAAQHMQQQELVAVLVAMTVMMQVIKVFEAAAGPFDNGMLHDGSLTAACGRGMLLSVYSRLTLCLGIMLVGLVG